MPKILEDGEEFDVPESDVEHDEGGFWYLAADDEEDEYFYEYGAPDEDEAVEDVDEE